MTPIDNQALRVHLRKLREFPPLLRVAAELIIRGYSSERANNLLNSGDFAEVPAPQRLTIVNYMEDLERGHRVLTKTLVQLSDGHIDGGKTPKKPSGARHDGPRSK